MKKPLPFLFQWLIAFLLASASSVDVFSQIITDDFSDGNFTSNPTWIGDDAVFMVNAQGQLQLNNTVADQSAIGTTFTEASLDNREWSFYFRQGFSGSDNNQSRLYFSASATATDYTGSGSAGVTGYFLKLGEAGTSDVIRIYKDDGVTTAEIAACTTIFNSSSNNEAGIKITRDDAGNWNILIDAAGGTNYVSEATFTDNSYNTSAAISWICTYTASNGDAFFIDDVYFGNIIVDTAPPQLLSATATGATTLDVLFDEAVSIASCEDENNYEVLGFASPSSAIRDADNYALVHLTFASSFAENVTQTLEAQAIEDEAGNALTTAEAEFIWFVAAAPEYRSVVFNEVLADPTPLVGLPDAEYVEIFNASNEVFDLNGWQFVNTTTAKTLPSVVLEPGEYVVLCDANLASQFINAIGITSPSALTNTTDSLTLLDNNGNVIDVLVYNVDWYSTSEKADGGWSLEQINPFYPCANNSGNWAESANASGGTPAAQNSIYNDAPDNAAPTVVAHGITDINHIFIHFSEPIDTAGFDPFLDLQPFNSTTGATWNASLTEVLYTTQSPLNPPGVWATTIAGLADCSGNVITNVELTFWAGFAPEVGDIIINEIYADPSETSAIPFAEFVEVYNKSNKVLDLFGMQLNSGVIEQQFILMPGEYVLLADDADEAAFMFWTVNKLFLSSFPGLTNSGLLLELKDASDNTLDEVTYDITWYRDADKIDGGWTLELINPNDPCSNGDNWRASVATQGGTPAAQNSVHDETPDTAAPQLLYVLSEPQESITLVFNEPLDEASLAGLSWTVNGETQSGFNAQFTNSQGTSVVLYYGEMEPGVIYTFDLLSLSDCWGNDAGLMQGRFALPETPQVGDIIINEILSNPYEGGKDFIEIYNNSLHNISLANWSIADATNNEMNEGKTITEIQFILYPNEYLVLTEALNPLSTFYPGTQSDQIIVVEDLPDFSADDRVFLLMPVFAAVSDSVYYNDDFHYALLNSTDGVSLERIAFSRPSNDATNWHSASEYVGFATPGYQNSQSNNNFATEQSFEVVNEIFSPDNDGYQDVVTFAYNLDEPGYTGNITIYDSEGRSVRKLMQNDLLGMSGSISWDGFNDERQKASIGIYVVYFEVFNLKGGVSKFKKTCVVAHRLD
ncbi:MAG: lamin tail domain-containing protein [Flavobacteriales bacterium]